MNHIFPAIATAGRARPLLARRGGVPQRIALLLILATLAVPPLLRRRAALPALPAACALEGRGQPPRHWLGCQADPGPRRALADEERLHLGLPLDPNRAGARALAFVPGLTRRLAQAVVEDRAARGRYASLQDLRRVRGIGERRLEQARARLAILPP